MSWLDTLQNASIKFSVTDYTADSELTYEEMLVLFQNMCIDGVTSEEFSDLNPSTNGYSLFENNYVRTISYNVINGHPSNATFTGGVKSSSGIVSLGNMKAGMSADQATLLVGKWFLGIDLPIPNAGGDSANPDSTGGTYPYAQSTGSLGTPEASDVNQGTLGTCYLLAALGAIADKAPQYINNAIIDNGNGSFGIRFSTGKNNGLR